MSTVGHEQSKPRKLSKVISVSQKGFGQGLQNSMSKAGSERMSSSLVLNNMDSLSPHSVQNWDSFGAYGWEGGS
jgi:hypothetical protein